MAALTNSLHQLERSKAIRGHIDRKKQERAAKREPLSPETIITLCYKSAVPIPTIATANRLPLHQVMEVLEFDFYCSECGRGVDLSSGRPCWAAFGDEGVGYWGTSCDDLICPGDGAFINRSGNEYLGGSPYGEDC